IQANGGSNTLLAGEKHVPTGGFGIYATGDSSAYNLDSSGSSSRAAGPTVPLAMSPNAPFNLNFGSAHSGGVCQFVFCDGRVRSLSPSIDPVILGRLANRDNREPIPPLD